VMLSLSVILFSIPSREPFTKISFLLLFFKICFLRQLDFDSFLLHENSDSTGASYISFVECNHITQVPPNKLFL
jgi:hypothetical protein